MGGIGSGQFGTQQFNQGGATTVATTTFGDLLYQAARIAGILKAPQRTLAPEEQTDGLAIANAFLDQMANERLLVYHVIRSVQNVVANQQSYLIGAGAPDWNVTRPLRIEFAGLIQTTTTLPTELPVSILTPQDWASIAVKAITGSTPQKLYYEPTFLPGEPWGTVRLYPVPQIANQIALYIWQQFGQFMGMADPVAFPPGYLRFLQYNLAKELTMRPWSNTAGMSELALAEAAKSKAWVKSMNRPNMDLQMRCEGAADGLANRGRWDITTNQWRVS